MVKIRIDFFVWETISAFKTIQRYIELIESHIGKAKGEEWLKLKELPVPRDEEEYQTEYVPIIQSHKHEFEKVLPRLVGYSFVMMLFSELEFRLNGIAREIKKRENVPLKISDLKGNIIQRFSKFLSSANKPQLSQNEKSEINDFMIVRNCIVHNNGFLNNFGKVVQLKNIVKSKIHIEIEDKSASERIKVTSRFCHSRIEFVIAMFRRLFKDLNFGPEFPIISDEES